MLLQHAFQGPVAINEPHVSKLVVLLHTDRAAELTYLVLEFENSVATIHYKKVLKGLTFLIKAITEPTQAISNLAVPGALAFPRNFLNVS